MPIYHDSETGEELVTEDTPELERMCKCCRKRYLTKKESEEYHRRIFEKNLSPLFNQIDTDTKRRFEYKTLMDIPDSEYNDIFKLFFKDKPYGLRIDKLVISWDNTLSVSRSGDICIGFIALEDVKFTLSLGNLSYTYIMQKNEFKYAFYDTFMINLVGLQYYVIYVSPMDIKDKVIAVYANLEGDVRKKLARVPTYYQINDSEYIVQNQGMILGTTPTPTFPSTIMHSMKYNVKDIIKIQKYWRESLTNPNYVLCKKRLENEFRELIS